MKKHIFVFLITFALLICSILGYVSISSANTENVVYEITFEENNAGSILSKFGVIVGKVVEFPENSGNHCLAYTIDSTNRTGNGGVHPMIWPLGIGDYLVAQGNMGSGDSYVFSLDIACSEATSANAVMYPFLITDNANENYFTMPSDGFCPSVKAFKNGVFSLDHYFVERPVDGETSGGIAFCDENTMPSGATIYLDNVRLVKNGSVTPVLDGKGIFFRDTEAPVSKSYKSSSTDSLLGDTNLDGNIDMKDVLTMRKAIASIAVSSYNKDNADCNRDGNVDMKDVLLLRKFIAKLITSFDDITTTTTSKTGTTTSRQTPTGPTTISFDTDTKNGSLGVWWWNNNSAQNASSYNTILNFLEDNHCTEIYLWASGMTNTQITTFIRDCASRGIRVAWLSGDVSWILPGNNGFNNFYNEFITYQNQAPSDAKFYGIHLDVEPHQNGQLSNEVKWQYYATLVNTVTTKTHSDGYLVEWDIPFWTETLTFGVDFGNQSNVNLTEAVMSASDTVVLMSYRDTASAILDTGKEELALENSTNCKVVLGVELSPSSEGDFITFYEEGKAAMVSELSTVMSELRKKTLNEGYGVALHYIDTWMNLKD